MKNKYIIYSITAFLFGCSLLISGLSIKSFKDIKEKENIDIAREKVSYAISTKNENDIIIAKESITLLKEEVVKEELESIVNSLEKDIMCDKFLNDYKEKLNLIKENNNLDDINIIRESISNSECVDIKEELFKLLDDVELFIQENSKKIIPVIETLTGKVTAFTPYCSDGCNGYVASGMYVGGGNIYYDDSEYGRVRIVAGDKSYPFGTIVRLKNLWYFGEDIYAIVLDRGGAIGKNKRALFDLLFEYESSANNFGVENATCEILRIGY